MYNLNTLWSLANPDFSRLCVSTLPLLSDLKIPLNLFKNALNTKQGLIQKIILLKILFFKLMQ